MEGNKTLTYQALNPDSILPRSGMPLDHIVIDSQALISEGN
jgi:hypothetical protein